MDAELRTLERAALGGGARERLAWARGLERAGKGEDAVRALIPVRDDAAVRAHLEALPSWSHPHGDAGRTNFLDARPVARAPVVLWKTELPGYDGGRLVASPLAAVWMDDSGTSILDPETGSVRRLERHSVSIELHELRAARLVVDDRTEARVSAIDVLAGTSRMLARGGTLTRVHDRDLVVRRLETVVSGSWIGADGRTTLRQWRYPARGRLEEELRGVEELVVGPTRVVLWGNGLFVLLDRETGGEVARGEGLWICVDAAGFAGNRAREAFACDANGRELWARAFLGKVTVTALAPDFVVVLAGQRTLALDRRSGKTLRTLAGWAKTLAVVRDVVYTRSLGVGALHRLHARRVNGEQLWTMDMEDEVEAVAALDGRLYVAASRREPRTTSILCLTEPRDHVRTAP